MKYVKPIFKYIKSPFKKLKLYIKQRTGWLGIPKIQIYRGFGNNKDVYINGVVIEDKGLSKPKEAQKVRENILATIKRFASDEIAGVRIKMDFLNQSKVTTTDEFGHFNFHFNLQDETINLGDKEWYTAHATLLDNIVENQPVIRSSGEIRMITNQQERIVISDIDDTVLISHSTNTFRKIRLMLFKNALTRLPFKGVSKFYSALEKGKDGFSNHPFFYVSSSEWNLYDLLEDFFTFNHIPKGVFLLKKLNHSIYKFWKSGGGTHEHKYEKIKFLLTFYKNQKFILLGDNGQQDPFIYKRLALEFPNKIEAVYIRTINKKKTPSIKKDVEDTLSQVNTYYVSVTNTIEAVEHAKERGYITSNFTISFEESV